MSVLDTNAQDLKKAKRGVCSPEINIQDMSIKKGIRLAIASIIAFFLGIILLLPTLESGLHYIIFMSFLYSAFVLDMISHVFFLADRKVSRYFAITAVVLFIFGMIVSFITGTSSHWMLVIDKGSSSQWLLESLYGLFWTAAFILAITVHLISFGDKKLTNRYWLGAAILPLSIALVITTCRFLHFTLPNVYTSPAITSKKLRVYNQCINFLKEHDVYPELGWYSDQRGVILRHYCYMSSMPPFREQFKKETGFPEDAIVEMEKLAKQIKKVKCHKVLRDNNMVLFYMRWYYTLPISPGVLYSLDGKNPKEIDSEVLNPNKPFTKIGGNWYMSRFLVIPNWTRATVAVPKSLIDHSLQTKGVKLEK